MKHNNQIIQDSRDNADCHASNLQTLELLALQNRDQFKIAVIQQLPAIIDIAINKLGESNTIDQKDTK